MPKPNLTFTPVSYTFSTAEDFRANRFSEHDRTDKPFTTDFKFKFVAEQELLRIVQKVRREKRREQEEKVWQRHLEEANVAALQSLDHVSVASDEKDSPISEKDVSEQVVSHQEVKHPLSVSKPASCTDFQSSHTCGHTQRIIAFRHRIGLALDSISTAIDCKPEQPDGPDDQERRRTRSNEFLSRFSRNYLFQLRMQVLELRRQVLNAAPESPGRHTQHQALRQKLVAAHQTAAQSLQACISQLPETFHSVNILGKLQELLHYVCDLCILKKQLESNASIMSGCADQSEISDEIHLKCKDLMFMIEEKRLELDDICSSGRISSPSRLPNSVRPRQRLGMYHTMSNARHSVWKRSATHLAHAHFGQPSSVRSSMSPRFSSREWHSSDDNKYTEDSIQNTSKPRKKPSDMAYMELVRPNSQGSSGMAKLRHPNYRADKRRNIQKPAMCDSSHKSKVGHLSKSQASNCPFTLVNQIQDSASGLNCTSQQLKAIVLHMHEVLCGKLNQSSAKRHCQRQWCERKPKNIRQRRGLTEVHNISENVQLVLTRHPDSDTDTRCDVATDTADFNEVDGDLSERKGEKKNKKVGWKHDDEDADINAPQATKDLSHETNSKLSGSPCVKWQHVQSYRERFLSFKEELQRTDVHRCCEDILDSALLDVATELEPSILVEKMYNLEFQE